MRSRHIATFFAAAAALAVAGGVASGTVTATTATKAKTASILETDFVGFGQKQPGVANVQVRLGISLALNRPALARLLSTDAERTPGTRTMPAASMVPAQMPSSATINAATNAFFEPMAGPQTAAAEAALTAGGYVAGTPLTLAYSTGGDNPAFEREIVADLTAVGVTITPVPLDPRARHFPSANSFDLFLAAWQDPYVRADAALLSETCRNAQQLGGYCATSYDQLLGASLRKVLPPAKRIADWSAMENLLTGPAGTFPVAPLGSEFVTVPANDAIAAPALS